jgi:hypothetical protein
MQIKKVKTAKNTLNYALAVLDCPLNCKNTKQQISVK